MPLFFRLPLLLLGLLTVILTAGLIGVRRTPADSAWLAFTPQGNGNLYRIRLDGRQLVPLTDNFYYNYSPVWSPDGNSLYFSSNMDGDGDVYQTRIDGSGLQQLTGEGRDAMTEEDIQVSADGQWLSLRIWPFTAGYAAKYEIYVMHPDGSAARGLTNLSRLGIIVHNVRWSPDGKRIAVNASLPERGGEVAYVTWADGGELIELPAQITILAWMADGAELIARQADGVLVALQADAPFEMRVLDATLQSIQRVAVAPDGQSLLVVSACQAYVLRMCLYRLSLDGQLEQMAGPYNWIPTVLWSARGEWIALVAAGRELQTDNTTPLNLTTDRDNMSLYRLRADGSDLQRVAAGVQQEVAWAPPIEKNWGVGGWMLLVMGVWLMGVGSRASFKLFVL